MFAVVILGIGFIMVAAIFPVAIKQTQASVEESFTAAMSRNGASYMEKMAAGGYRGRNTNVTPALFPDLATFFGSDLILAVTPGANDPAFVPPRANAAVPPGDYPRINTPGSFFARGKLLAMGDLRVFNRDDPDTYYPLRSRQLLEGYANAIVPTDPRYAFIPLFRRDRAYNCRESVGLLSIEDERFVAEDSSVAQLVLFGVQVRNRTEFRSTDLPLVPSEASTPPVKLANLEPRPVAVRVGRIRELIPASTASDADSTFIVQFASCAALNAGGVRGQVRGGFPAGAAIDRILNAGPAAVTEGCYFVISDDRIVNDVENPSIAVRNIGKSAGLMNGRIYRVGIERTDLGANTWELYPGYEFTPDPGANGVFDTNQASSDDILMIGQSAGSGSIAINGKSYVSNVQVDGTGAGQGAVAFVMGRALSDNYINSTNPNAAPEFDGTAMDVSVYTTIIKVK